MIMVNPSRFLGLSISIVALNMATGCLTLTTTAQEGQGGSGGTSASSGSGSGSGSSGNACANVEDCPSVKLCKTMACTDGMCVSEFVPAGLPCDDSRVCDGDGSCVECMSDNDCFGNGATCENNKCVSCNDGQINGEETGVDCGGSKCAPCAIMCTDSGECASQHCADGVCCDSDCTGACKSCNLPNSAGKCTNLPPGTEDPGVCDTTQACSGLASGCKLKNGQSCTDDSQCLSFDCSIDKVCEPD